MNAHALDLAGLDIVLLYQFKQCTHKGLIGG